MSICLSTLSTATMSPCCLSPFHPYSTNRVSVIWPDPAAWSADQGKDKFVEVCTAYLVVRLYRSSRTRHYAPLWSELSTLEARGATGQHICFFPLPHMLLQIYLYFHFQHLIILLPLLQIYLNFHFQHPCFKSFNAFYHIVHESAVKTPYSYPVMFLRCPLVQTREQIYHSDNCSAPE